MSENDETITMQRPSPERENLLGPAPPKAFPCQALAEATLASSSPMNDEYPDQLGETLQFGPYRVQVNDIVGSGGMGIVYRGVHADTGEVVAIKVAHKAVRSVSDGHLTAIRREIRALRRVRHPGIVRILADGVSDGVPWVAMPFLKGHTLQKHLEDLRTKPPSAGSRAGEVTLTADLVGAPPHVIVTTPSSVPSRRLVPTLTLIRRLCAPLAFLHGEGLVHRDLKPANIFLLEEDDRPVILDLGLAVHFGGASGREELDVERCAGTVFYMAPEQLRGELVDARADLYALGCILYECVTGQPPFTGKSKDSIRAQHFCAQPIPPSLRIPGLPEELDDLILSLLKKCPRDRIGYATDVAAALAALGAEDGPNEGPRPQDYLYRPDLLDRADALAMLEKAVHATKQGRGGLFLVHGESGVGKTRLANEVTLRAARHELANGERLSVLTGCCMAPGAGSVGTTAVVTPPLHPLLPVLVAAADRVQDSRAEADRIFGPRGKVLSAYVPELSKLPGQAEQPSPPPLPPKKARARVIAALRQTLWALAERSPLVIMLDDVQWADDLTLSVLLALVRAGLANRGILIVAMYRSEEPRPELEELSHAPGVTSIPLGRLDGPNIAVMVKGMLARSASRPVLDALIHHSNGNPFFVAEYLRAAISEGFLRRDESGRFCFDARGAAALSSLPLPRTLEELIKRRLGQLDVEGQELAEWAAVLGQELNAELLLSSARDAAAAMEAFEVLRARQILEETREGQLRFVHDKLREIAYRQIDDAARIEWHRRAGEALEARYADRPDKAPALGHHFAEAGIQEKAGLYFARAAAQAQEVYANGDAIRFYQAAIDAFRRSPSAEAERAKIAELHEQLGDVLALIGQQEEAREAYRGVLQELPLPHHFAPVRLYRKIGKTWEMRHKHTEALDLYVQAESALGKPPALPSETRLPEVWWQEWIQIQIDRISVHYWKAEKDSLSYLVETIRPMVEQQGTALLRGHYFHALTQRNIQIERFVASDETVRYARECLAAYEAVGDVHERHWVVSARFSLAFVLMLHGPLEEAKIDAEAEEKMDAALHAAERMGDLEVQTRCLTYLTFIHRRLRRLGPAEKLARRSLELAKAEQVNEYAGAALGNLASIALSHGDLAKAKWAGQEALEYWKRIELVYPFQWLARLPLCFVALAEKRLENAIEQVRAVLDIPKQRQQRLPKGLTTKLEEAINAFDTGQEALTKKALSQARRTAEALGYA